MAMATVDLVGNAAIDQGLEWKALIKIPGDHRNDTFKGQICKAPGSAVLADFRFEFPTYDPSEDTTDLNVLLTPAQTQEIESTLYELWSYDIRMNTLLQGSKLLIRGVVQVNRIVTQQ